MTSRRIKWVAWSGPMRDSSIFAGSSTQTDSKHLLLSLFRYK